MKKYNFYNDLKDQIKLKAGKTITPFMYYPVIINNDEDAEACWNNKQRKVIIKQKMDTMRYGKPTVVDLLFEVKSSGRVVPY